jgi:hypothetical protein
LERSAKASTITTRRPLHVKPKTAAFFSVINSGERILGLQSEGEDIRPQTGLAEHTDLTGQV